MAMNRELIGRTYAASTYEVKEEAMIRYALATNETNPRFLHSSVEGGVIAPPVFPVVYHAKVLGKPISDPELNIEFRRALHGEQDMTFHRSIRAGDVLSTTPSIEDIREKGTGETISIRLRTENQSGELVEETLFKLFVRGDPKNPAGPKASPKKAEAAAVRADESMATISQELDADQTFRYSEASGDRTKIHLDVGSAQRAGLPGIIGHGLCTMAFVSKVLVDELAAGDPTRLARMSLRFAKPVIPGQDIETTIWNAESPGTFRFETLDPRKAPVISQGLAEIRPEAS